jgi:hypothetical protein
MLFFSSSVLLEQAVARTPRARLAKYVLLNVRHRLQYYFKKQKNPTVFKRWVMHSSAITLSGSWRAGNQISMYQLGILAVAAVKDAARSARSIESAQVES